MPQKYWKLPVTVCLKDIIDNVLGGHFIRGCKVQGRNVMVRLLIKNSHPVHYNYTLYALKFQLLIKLMGATHAEHS
jgi:hypothetical protein